MSSVIHGVKSMKTQKNSFNIYFGGADLEKLASPEIVQNLITSKIEKNIYSSDNA